MSLQVGGTSLQVGGTSLQRGGMSLQHEGTSLRNGVSSLHCKVTALHYKVTSLHRKGISLQPAGTSPCCMGMSLRVEASSRGRAGTSLQHAGMSLQRSGPLRRHGGRSCCTGAMPPGRCGNLPGGCGVSGRDVSMSWKVRMIRRNAHVLPAGVVLGAGMRYGALRGLPPAGGRAGPCSGGQGPWWRGRAGHGRCHSRRCRPVAGGRGRGRGREGIAGRGGAYRRQAEGRQAFCGLYAIFTTSVQEFSLCPPPGAARRCP